jgi:hypothetical protein
MPPGTRKAEEREPGGPEGFADMHAGMKGRNKDRQIWGAKARRSIVSHWILEEEWVGRAILRGTAMPSVSRGREERESGGRKGFAGMRSGMGAGKEERQTCLRYEVWPQGQIAKMSNVARRWRVNPEYRNHPPFYEKRWPVKSIFIFFGSFRVFAVHPSIAGQRPNMVSEARRHILRKAGFRCR